MRKVRVFTLWGLLFLGLWVSVASAGVWRVKVRPGVMVGEEAASDFYVDAFVPVAGDNDTVLFMNYIYRFGTNESQEWNLGLGLRQMWRNWIFGGVLYYDWLSSSLGNHYDQVTLALEALSNKYFDARLNFYWPTGRHVTRIEDRNVFSGYVFSGRGLWEVYERVRRYEEAAKGVEFEVGRLVPWVSRYVETRAYAGLYGWDFDLARDMAGYKFRFEVRPCELINFDFQFQHDDVRGSDWWVGGFVEIPLPFWGKGEGGFWAGLKRALKLGRGPRPLRERMTEKVRRDLYVVTGKVAESRVERHRVTRDPATGLPIPEIIFVSANATEGGDGSIEHPYNDLSQAVAAAGNGTWIYIFGSSGVPTFHGVAVTLKPGMVLWGQHYRHPVFGCPAGSCGPRPVLYGNGTAPVITLSSGNRLWGLEVTLPADLQGSEVNGIEGIGVSDLEVRDLYVHGFGGRFKDLGGNYFASGAGLYLEAFSGTLSVHESIFNNNTPATWGWPSGIEVIAAGGSEISVAVSDSVFRGNNKGSGLDVWSGPFGGNATLEVAITDSVFENNAWGAGVWPYSNSRATVTVRGSNFTNNSEAALDIFVGDSSAAKGTVLNSTFKGDAYWGLLSIGADSNSWATVTVENSVFEDNRYNNLHEGIGIDVSGNSVVNLAVTQSILKNNDRGLEITTDNGGEAIVDLGESVIFDNNTEDIYYCGQSGYQLILFGYNGTVPNSCS